MMRVNQLLKPSAVDTSAFNDLPPRHKEVVNDFYNQVNYDNKDVVKEVENTINIVSDKHNVNTDVMYNYINKEVGE